MGSEKHNERAFPAIGRVGEPISSGMSMWDYFAAHAPLNDVPGYTQQYGTEWLKALAAHSAEYADAMMVERAKRVPPV